MPLTVSIPYIVGDADVRSSRPVARRVPDAEQAAPAPVMQRPRRVDDCEPKLAARKLVPVQRVDDDKPLTIRRVDQAPVKIHKAPKKLPLIARRVPDEYCGCPPKKPEPKKPEPKKPAPKPEPKKPAPKPEPKKPAPKPEPKPEPKKPAPGQRGRLEQIERNEEGALVIARGNRKLLTNVGLQTELAAYAYKKGLYPPGFAPYALGRLNGLAGYDKAARDAVLSNIKVFEGLTTRGVVYDAVRASIDHLSGAKCSIKQQQSFLRKSILELDRLGKVDPPCSCGCGGAPHA